MQAFQSQETFDKAAITYWFGGGAFCPREKGYKKGPMKNPLLVMEDKPGFSGVS
ncbi:MAG: hypothetical protein ACP5QG_01330 [candidate division WOR-3 bacterium]